MFVWTRTMPLEVLFSPSIVLVAVDVVYVVVSHGRPRYPSPRTTSSTRPPENPLAAKRRAFYVRSAEFFHSFHLALCSLFSQTARVCVYILYTRTAVLSLFLSWGHNVCFRAHFASLWTKNLYKIRLEDQVGIKQRQKKARNSYDELLWRRINSDQICLKYERMCSQILIFDLNNKHFYVQIYA